MKIDNGIVNIVNEFMNLPSGAVFVGTEDKCLYLKLDADSDSKVNVVNLKTNRLSYMKSYEAVVEIDAKLVGVSETQQLNCCNCDNEDEGDDDDEESWL